MDVPNTDTQKMAADIAVNVAGGTGITLLAAFALWMRRLVGLPKRMLYVEQSTAVLLSSQIPLIDAAMFGMDTKCSDEREPEAERIKSGLASERARLMDHLTKISRVK